jgi:outer membrane protease
MPVRSDFLYPALVFGCLLSLGEIVPHSGHRGKKWQKRLMFSEESEPDPFYFIKCNDGYTRSVLRRLLD